MYINKYLSIYLSIYLFIYLFEMFIAYNLKEKSMIM